jgi:alpha-L-rhamnosidase
MRHHRILDVGMGVGAAILIIFLSCRRPNEGAFNATSTTSDPVSRATRYQQLYETPEPFPYLHDYCADCLHDIPESPDPLVSYTWSASVNTSQLQIYRIHQPTSYKVIPSDAISKNDLERFFSISPASQNSSTSSNTSAITRPSSLASLKIYRNCIIVLDWGVERAAWFELQIIVPPTAQVLASISEFNEPYPGKTKALTHYGNHTYRLETNEELYEGVRFSFVHITFVNDGIQHQYRSQHNTEVNHYSPPRVEIRDVSLVAKIKPVAYTGRFHSSNTQLTQAWYTGAYGVRLNMEANGFNSVLVERGDRVAIQGDGHPTIDTALVAFPALGMIKYVLLQTDSSRQHVVDDSIMAYPLYWCLSAMDYYWASGDQDFFVNRLYPDIQLLLDKRINDFLDPNLDITWFGWDDRVGNGWCYHSNDKCNREAHLSFAALVIRVCNDFSRALHASRQTDLANHYFHQSTRLGQLLRQVLEYPHDLGVHAAANVLNAVGLASVNETQYWMLTTLNDPVTICSFSQFNQYWILQAFGNVGDVHAMERALESIKLCWGPMMKLGKGCFWELSSPEWLRFLKDGDSAPHLPSYCHPWASGVTAWLTHVLGGLFPLQPGYNAFAAIPYVSATHPYVSTSMATPSGYISVNETLNDDLSVEILIDSACPGIVGLRSDVLGYDGTIHPLEVESVMVNNRPANAISQSHVRRLLGNRAITREAYSFFLLPQDGNHLVSAKYQSHHTVNSQHESLTGNDRRISSATPFPKLWYPATTALDRTSQGDGLIEYGQDGYVLFGCNESSRDVVQLPPYIANLTVIRHGFPGYVEVEREFIGYSDTNPSFLPLTGQLRRSIAKRGLGRINLNDMGAGDLNCLLMDVKISEEFKSTFRLSVYSVANSSINKHAIRVMDGDTFNVIAPTPLIDDYGEGVWWTVQYNNSIRLKFLDMKGIFLSAVAFRSI